MKNTNNKSLYKEYCKNSSVPVFCRPFWLDAVCDEWEVITAEENGSLSAFLPLALKKKSFFKALIPPPVTIYCGPVFVADQIPPGAKKYSFFRRQFKELYTRARAFDAVQFTSLQSFDYPAAVQWAGFSVRTKTAHIIRDFEQLSYRSNIKRKINKADKYLEVKEVDFDMFYEVNKKTFSRKKKKLPYAYTPMKNAVNRTVERNNALVLGAFNREDNTLCGGIVFLTDETGVYLFLSGMDPEHKELGSQPLLTHTGIELARELGVPFHFCGSNQESIARFFESMGGVPENYFVAQSVQSRFLKLIGVLS